MNNGIMDRVAVVGMGCTKFGERYEASKEDLIVEAVKECIEDSNIELKDIDAFWFGTFHSEEAGVGLSQYLKTENKPVTRVENFCCTGTDAFRNACYAVASGAYDVVMAVGMEKLKDNGYSGLWTADLDCDKTETEIAPPSLFAVLAPAYAKKYGLSYEQLREVLINITKKNHHNGSLNPKAMYQTDFSVEQIAASPWVAAPYLTVMDSSGVSDGCACAIIMRTDMARKHRKDPMYVKGLNIATASGHSKLHSSYDFTSIPEVVNCAQTIYKQVGITDPAKQLSLAEVHDCFTITELILYEDLGFSKRGEGWRDLLDGKFSIGGELPVNIDGGLKSFGHPIGASGIRMLYESWLQFHGKAGKRQLEDPRLGLAHNLGGMPYMGVQGITIVGNNLG